MARRGAREDRKKGRGYRRQQQRGERLKITKTRERNREERIRREKRDGKRSGMGGAGNEVSLRQREETQKVANTNPRLTVSGGIYSVSLTHSLSSLLLGLLDKGGKHNR